MKTSLERKERSRRRGYWLGGVVIPALLFIWAGLHRFINMEKPDKFNVSLWQVSALAAGCREYREKAVRYPTSGVQIVFFFRDKTHDRIRDAWGNYIEFNTNGLGGLHLSTAFEYAPGKTSTISAYLEP